MKIYNLIQNFKGLIKKKVSKSFVDTTKGIYQSALHRLVIKNVLFHYVSFVVKKIQKAMPLRKSNRDVTTNHTNMNNKTIDYF